MYSNEDTCRVRPFRRDEVVPLRSFMRDRFDSAGLRYFDIFQVAIILWWSTGVVYGALRKKCTHTLDYSKRKGGTCPC